MEQLLTSKEVLQVDLDFTKNELSVTKGISRVFSYCNTTRNESVFVLIM
jgi:hypothetical protein